MNLQFFSTVSSDVKEAITNEWVAGTLCEWKQLYNSIMWFIRETWINYYLTESRVSIDDYSNKAVGGNWIANALSSD